MKRTIILAFAFIMTAVSCVKSETAWSGLAGKWIPESASSVADRYCEFKSGNFTVYTSAFVHPVIDGTVWNCDDGDFSMALTGRYSILSNVLVCAGRNLGEIVYDSDAGKLEIDGEKYIPLRGFKEEAYSKLVIQGPSEFEVPSTAYSGEISFTITNPVPGYSKLSFSSDEDWINNFFMDGNTVRFSVDDANHFLNEPRVGRFTISYPFAEDVGIKVTQKP